MEASVLIGFALIAFIGIVTPGPTVLLAFSNGSRFGTMRALPGMAGAVLSDFVLIGAVGLGLGALLAASEFWFSVLKWVGVAYLAWLGATMLRSQGSLGAALDEAATLRDSGRRLFLKSFLVAATNPKGYLFFTAFLPQFVDPAQSQLQQYVVLALIFASLDWMIMLGYAVLGSQAAKALKTHAAKWLDRACGGVLLALAGSLALYRRAGN